MCDYSLHAVATRPAKIAETLVSTGFSRTTTHGFAGIDDPAVAVCLRPGTELVFEADVQSDGYLFGRNIGDRLARFRQIDLDKPDRHHDALEFSNGQIVMVANLRTGQRARVLQLPVDPDRIQDVVESQDAVEGAVEVAAPRQPAVGQV